MKRSMFVASALMTLILVFTACGGEAASPIVEAVKEVLVTPTPGPALTVEQIGDIFQEALNSGNIDPFIEILADDFVFTQDEGPGRDLLTLTKVAYIERIAGNIASNDQITLIDRKAEGNKGTSKFSMTADDLTAIGVDKITGTFEFEVSQGKLVKLHTAYDSESVQKLAAAPLDGTLTLGTVTAAQGQLIEVPVTLDVDVPIRGIQLNLVYDGSLLQSGVGKRGSALPEGWQVFGNEPSPGDLRIITLSFEGDSFIPDKEPVLLAGFRIAPDAPKGDIPTSVALLDVADAANNRLDLAIVNGTVKVIGNPGHGTAPRPVMVRNLNSSPR